MSVETSPAEHPQGSLGGSNADGPLSPPHRLLSPVISGPKIFSPKVVVALAAVWIIWGSTYLGIKIGLETLPPFFMQGSRFVLAAGIMLTVLRIRRVPWPSRLEIRNACVIGVLLLVGGLGLVTIAEDRGVDTGLVATIIAIQPMMMSLWGGLWRNWPRRIEWIGMLIGLGGVAILMSDG
jgi:drug/metabolite transporter (DMT)-like permease